MLDLKQLEEKLVSFWKSHRIFELSLEQNRNKRRFVFLEGPPFTNNKPHFGHFLTRAYKDTILRFRTMIGDYAQRVAGWDTHGLPIEVATEKELGIKNKKDIQTYGITNFNQKCKSLVTVYKQAWEQTDERIGFWIDHQNAYITLDPFYMESCWWIIQQIYKQGLLKEEHRSQPYCPRCETVLSQAELGQPDAYKEVLDPDIYVKLKLKDRDESLLIWTTTPWTLPANIAIAVNPELNYHLFDIQGQKIWAAQLPSNITGVKITSVQGRQLIGLAYEPLYPPAQLENFDNAYKVYGADFIESTEGTGLVHIAPAFGEDDFNLGKAHNLPFINPINETGEFEFDDPATLSSKINGLFFKDADRIILEDLETRGFILSAKLKGYKHDYPHCWRCKTPLLYYATKAWVIKTSVITEKLIKENDKIQWHPKTVKNRFYEWLKEGKDWNLSRTRFWGIPLPLWRCDSCGEIEVIGSLKELAKHRISKNDYYFLRHGEAVSNKKNLLSSYPEPFFNPLTPRGLGQIKALIPKLKRLGLDLIVSSPLLRAKDTAEFISSELGLPVVFDLRLREIDFGVINGKSVDDYQKLKRSDYDQYFIAPEHGETLNQVRQRMIKVILDLESKYQGRKILIVSHQDPLQALAGEMQGLSIRQTAGNPKLNFALAELKKIEYLVLPRDEQGEINLHRPYVDEFTFVCKCGGQKQRVNEIADIWFDSGCTPFSSYHYPFEHKKEIDTGICYPIDFIAEAVDQTRGWFYVMLVIGWLIKKQTPYKNVVVFGLVLDQYGKKMSKSLGNFIPSETIIEKYGADLPRFYLFYVNDVGDQTKFVEKELIDLKRNYFDLVINILHFYKLYYDRNKNSYKGKLDKNSLDLWFEARLKQTYGSVYSDLMRYNPHRAARALVELVQDFSTWWLRRSRDRFQKPKNKNEKLKTLLLLENYLRQLAIMSAPLNPFLSEAVYQELRREQSLKDRMKLSVHLEHFDLPKNLSETEQKLLEDMEKIREIVSDILRLRKLHRVKVRQPLKQLYLEVDKKTFSQPQLVQDYLKIIQAETNVKKIIIGAKPISEEGFIHSEEVVPLWLDLTLTQELKEEGLVNDFVRLVQTLRHDAELTPSQKINLCLEPSIQVKQLVEANKKRILEETNTSAIFYQKPKTFLVELETTFEDLGPIKLWLKN
jgi:isoleucyl-tRNA synthetase